MVELWVDLGGRGFTFFVLVGVQRVNVPLSRALTLDASVCRSEWESVG